MAKPWANVSGNVLKPIMGSPRKIKTELVPRVQNLVTGGVVQKPLWLDALLAHPPPLEHKFRGPRPLRFEWREEDRLRRVWQRRNPEASMHPKVLFLDESQLPASVAVEHPADVFIKKQQKLMRRGLSEEAAYRSVMEHEAERRRLNQSNVSAVREQARSLGLTPAVPDAADAAGAAGSSKKAEPEGFAARLLRRFAEEARDGGQPYPRHWFDDNGKWVGIGKDDLNRQTRHSFQSNLGVNKHDMSFEEELALSERMSLNEIDDDEQDPGSASADSARDPDKGGA